MSLWLTFSEAPLMVMALPAPFNRLFPGNLFSHFFPTCKTHGQGKQIELSI